MNLKIKNIELVRVINFLDKLNLAGLKGIYRTKLSIKLQEKIQDVIETEKELQEDLKDDKEKLQDDLKTLHESHAVIDGGDSRIMLESVKGTIKEIVEKEEEEFNNDDAYALVTLYEAFELGGDNE